MCVRSFLSDLSPRQMTTRILVVFPALCFALALRAQSPDSTARSTKPPTRKTVVTFNPIAIVAGYFGGDVETAVTPTVTLGAGASYAGFDNFNDYGALEGKIRYYPQERALYGFSVAGNLGLATYRPDGPYYASYDATGTLILPTDGSGDRRTRATVGTELSYQWLLGPKRRFATVIGVGVKRFLGAEDYGDPFDSNIIPTARINIGFAF